MPTLTDRLAARERPAGPPLMYQAWDKLLFIHWEIDVDELRRLIPAPVKIDTFEGRAYVATTPFTVHDVRPGFLPPLPWISAFHEINVRTYVHLDGVPGVWFFSLDANGLLAVAGARMFYHLPYHYATITMREDGGAGRLRRKTDERSSGIVQCGLAAGQRVLHVVAGIIGILSHRTILPLYDIRRGHLPLSHSPRALAIAPRAAREVRDHAARSQLDAATYE